jgi:hypothetical protein
MNEPASPRWAPAVNGSTWIVTIGSSAASTRRDSWCRITSGPADPPAEHGLVEHDGQLRRRHAGHWVVALPDGDAVVLPAAGRPIFTTLVAVRRRWAPLMNAELVQVAGRDALHTAG